MREFVRAAAEQIQSQVQSLNGLETREHKGKTPLLVAVTANLADVVSDLIELGADVTAADFKGQTALHLAATYGYPGILQVLLWSGVTVNVEDRNFEGLTALHCAVKSHNCTVRKLSEIRSRTAEIPTDLQTLAEDKLQCITLLLNMGASVFTQDIKNSMTVLHLSVQDGNLPLVQFFTQLRIPQLPSFLNMKAHGNTVLHMAAGLHGDCNQEEIIRLLLVHGADPTIRNMENEQPIHLLQASLHREQIKVMLKRGRVVSSSNHRFGSS
ncbi:NF-kappa-B inhibitor delta [Scyliorhinus torazame]|uniref:NF-kappa-B inhibitor delta n=1 Tax=Scyliorhinus torazame TaxID=75743 RepID=UPI003B5A9B57